MHSPHPIRTPSTKGVQWNTNSNVQTVVETPSYLALAGKLFSEFEMSEIVAMVAADPKCGDLMRETGRLPHYCLREERESQPYQKGTQRA
jgi:hypothetical protein